MSNALIPNIAQQFFGTDGLPLAGGQIFSFVAGTTTPAATYADASGVTPNANPVILDASGFPPQQIYIGSGTYKFVIKDAADVTIKTIDSVTWDFLTEFPSLWTEHAIADNAAAADLSGETVNGALYSSALYEAEIIRGSATFSAGQVSVQFVNGVARVRVGSFMGDNPGVTFSVAQTGMVAQLRAATSSGPGAGTIKLSRRLVPA